METIIIHGGYIGIMEKKMETTTVYWVMQHRDIGKMETTIGSVLHSGST